jgi:hypothetical protein
MYPLLPGYKHNSGARVHTSVFKSADVRIRLAPKLEQDGWVESLKAKMHFAFSDGPGLFSRAALLTYRQGVELIGELGDSGRLHQGRDPLLNLAPVRQCCLDRGLACGR